MSKLPSMNYGLVPWPQYYLSKKLFGNNINYAPSNNFITKVNWRLEGTSDIMLTPKLGVASILCWIFIIQKLEYSERVEHNQRIAVDPLRELQIFV